MRVLTGGLLLIVLPLLLSEFTDWCPWLAARLVRRAARLLPEPNWARYEEEWLAELHEVPGRLAKLAVAVSLCCGAVRMRAIFRRSRWTVLPWRQRLAALRWLLAPRSWELTLTTRGICRNGASMPLVMTVPRAEALRTRWEDLQSFMDIASVLVRVMRSLPDPGRLQLGVTMSRRPGGREPVIRDPAVGADGQESSSAP
jgi:hypothetical protein